MKQTTVEKLFTLFDETATVLENELECTYLEALAETGENIFHHEILQTEISEVAKKKLKSIMESSLVLLTIRKIFEKLFNWLV